MVETRDPQAMDPIPKDGCPDYLVQTYEGTPPKAKGSIFIYDFFAFCEDVL